jgi:glycosylphosphatidylinositol deacylase
MDFIHIVKVFDANLIDEINFLVKRKKKDFFFEYFSLGSPVLFIVGNADSYRQVRSLGSVAYRMGDKNNQLDYFSIDFNEELSALFGGVLEQQTEFVAYAIQTILSLYKTNKTIILVGNSIGGLLTRKIDLIEKIFELLIRI